jgi:mRNA interferase RelE/StbE
VGYALLANPSAQRELDALPPRIAEGIRAVLRALADEPRSKRFDLKVLQGGSTRSWRLRIGDYRVILGLDHERQEILVVRIGPRSTVYRGWSGGD